MALAMQCSQSLRTPVAGLEQKSSLQQQQLKAQVSLATQANSLVSQKLTLSAPHATSARAAARLVVKAAVAADAPNATAVTRKPVDTKKTVIVTGASSGLGLATAVELAKSGEWHVIMACRDFAKAQRAANAKGMQKGTYTILHLDLAALDSVRQFVDNFRGMGRNLAALVCNAAVYQPTAKEPSFTAEGFEESVGTNHLGHFLLANLLIDDLKKSEEKERRLIIVGSITGNTNTLAGNVPPQG